MAGQLISGLGNRTWAGLARGEGVDGSAEGQLGVVGVEQRHRHVEHQLVGGGHTADSPGAQQGLVGGVGPGGSVRQFLGQPVGFAEQVVVGDDPVDDAGVGHHAGGDSLGGECPFDGAGPSGAFGDPVDAAHDRRDRDRLLGVAELCRLAGEDHVGAEGELEPAAEAQAVDGGDHRHRQLLEAVEDVQEARERRPQFLHRCVRPRPDVSPEAKVGAFGAEHDGPSAAAFDGVQRVCELGDHLFVDAILRRMVEHEGGDLGVDVVGEVGHVRLLVRGSAHRAGVSMRWCWNQATASLLAWANWER